MLIMAVGIEFGDERLVAALVGRLIVGKILVDVVADDGDEHRRVAVFSAQCLANLAAHRRHARLGKGHIAEVLAHVHLDRVVLKSQGAHLEVTHAHVLGQLTRHHALHSVLLFLGEHLLLGMQRGSYHQRGCYT